MKSSTTPLKLAAIGLCALFTVTITLLTLFDKNVDNVVSFAMLMLTVVVGQLINGKQIDNVDTRTQNIERQVNGNLERQFQAIHQHVADATGIPAPERNDDNG